MGQQIEMVDYLNTAGLRNFGSMDVKIAFETLVKTISRI